MTYEELIRRFGPVRTRRHPTDDEHRLQCACVGWFRREFPQLRNILFAVPNGGRRDPVTGARLKAEGAVAGVSDLILLKPKGPYCCLCIEMKRPGGRQTGSQKLWQKDAEANGARYVVCRSLDEFAAEITGYLGG